MKRLKLVVTVCALGAAMPVMGQQVPTMGMKPEMTEVWEPEVQVVTPGRLPGEAPSDAILLFDGIDLAE